MASGGNPIVSARTAPGYVRLQVHPDIMGDAKKLQQLRLMLAAVCQTSDVAGRPTVYDETDRCKDVVVYRESESGQSLSWATADALNAALASLPLDPVRTVRDASIDMGIRVVVDFGPHETYKLQDYHAWHLKKELACIGVVHAIVSEEPLYRGRVVTLFVPEIDMLVELPDLIRAIKEALSFDLALSPEGEATPAATQ